MEKGPRFQGRLSTGFLQRKLGELPLVQSLTEDLCWTLTLILLVRRSWECQVLTSEAQSQVCVPLQPQASSFPCHLDKYSFVF